MIRLRCMIPSQIDATSLYRAIGPLSQIEKKMNLEFQFCPEWNWATLLRCDAVFMQRPFTSVHKDMLKMAKNLGKRVWVDYDDDLFNVPTDNPCYRQYMNHSTQKNVAYCLANADVVTVSTEYLRERYQDPEGRNKVFVVNNALPPVVKERNEKHPLNPVVMWRGSKTHERDLSTVAQDIVKLGNQHKSITWQFLGYNPWFITDNMRQGQSVVSEQLDPVEYFDYLNKIRPMFMIVPLHESKFNKSKSNIAWIEATYGGGVCIAPDMDEWRQPGVINYKQGSFKTAVEYAFSLSPEKIRELNSKSWERIQENYTLDAVNWKRQEILLWLAGQKEELFLPQQKNTKLELQPSEM